MWVRQFLGLAIVVVGIGGLLALGGLAPVDSWPPPGGLSGSCGAKGACGTSGSLGLPVELPGCCPGTLSGKEDSLMLPSSASSPNQGNLDPPSEKSETPACCPGSGQPGRPEAGAGSAPGLQTPVRKVQKTDQEWRTLLTPLQYQVTRQKGTERAFTGEYWNCTKPGVYRCICCGAELFSSEAKFLSKSGWPSFWQAIRPEAVETQPDHSHGMIRTEVLCRRCGAHLGHVFDDGPPPTGLRYCINSAALRLEEKPPQKHPIKDQQNSSSTE